MKSKYNLDLKSANDTLQNVFAACDEEPNTTSLKQIVITGIFNDTVTNICKWVSTAFLILVLLCPLAFYNPSFKVKGPVIMPSFTIVNQNTSSSECNIVLNGNTINYDSIYAVKEDGSTIYPTNCDIESGVVTFPYDGSRLVIYISDYYDETVQAILPSVH